MSREGFLDDDFSTPQPGSLWSLSFQSILIEWALDKDDVLPN